MYRCKLFRFGSCNDPAWPDTSIDRSIAKILHMQHRCSCYTGESLVFGYLMNPARHTNIYSERNMTQGVRSDRIRSLAFLHREQDLNKVVQVARARSKTMTFQAGRKPMNRVS